MNYHHHSILFTRQWDFRNLKVDRREAKLEEALSTGAILSLLIGQIQNCHAYNTAAAFCMLTSGQAPLETAKELICHKIHLYILSSIR